VASYADFDMMGKGSLRFLNEYGDFRRDICKTVQEQGEQIKALEDKIHVYEEMVRILGGRV